MKFVTRFALVFAFVVAAQTASAHVHINVDSDINRKLSITTYGDDGPGLTGSFFGTNGQWHIGGLLHTYAFPLAPEVTGPFAGFQRAQGPTFSVDGYTSPLMTAGSQFAFELVSLTPVAGSGAESDAIFGWRAGSDYAVINGLISGVDNQIPMAIDAHIHGRAFYIDTPGLYDVQFRVSGVDGAGAAFATSDPVTLRFGDTAANPIPEPMTASLVGLGGLLLLRRTRRNIA